MPQAAIRALVCPEVRSSSPPHSRASAEELDEPCRLLLSQVLFPLEPEELDELDELDELEVELVELVELDELPWVAREAAAPMLVPEELALLELEELLALETGATLGALFCDVWLTTVLLVANSTTNVEGRVAFALRNRIESL